jgi:hypothetical protein
LSGTCNAALSNGQRTRAHPRAHPSRS